MPVDGSLARRRADVDDPPVPPLAHAREHGLDPAHVAHHVQLPHRLPVGVGQLVERPLHRVADVVDETVDPTERRLRGSDERTGPIRFREVDGHPERGTDVDPRLLHRARVPAAQDDRRSLLGEDARRLEADARRRAGDEADAVLKPEIHGAAYDSGRDDDPARPSRRERLERRAALAGACRQAADGPRPGSGACAGRPARGLSADGDLLERPAPRARHRPSRRRAARPRGDRPPGSARGRRRLLVGTFAGGAQAAAFRSSSPAGSTARRAGRAARATRRWGSGSSVRSARSRRRTRTSTCSSFRTAERCVPCTPTRSASSSTHTGAAPRWSRMPGSLPCASRTACFGVLHLPDEL